MPGQIVTLKPTYLNASIASKNDLRKKTKSLMGGRPQKGRLAEEKGGHAPISSASDVVHLQTCSSDRN